jgi:GR25 family glycosyltransferase involved in LPS biosynthesis
MVISQALSCMPTSIALISDDPTRRKTLVESLNKIGLVHSKIFPTVSSDFQIPIVDLKAFFILNLRQFTRGELGCVIAHSIVYQSLLESHGEWFLIFEDSARIENDFISKLSEVMNFVKSIPVDQPVIVNLYNPKDFVFVHKTSSDLIFECLSLLRMAKGYLINKAALRIATTRFVKYNDVADWPEWITGIRQYGVIENMVFRDSSLESLTQEPPTVIRNLNSEQLIRAYRFLRLALYVPFIFQRLTHRKDFRYRIWFHFVLRRMPRFFLYKNHRNPYVVYFRHKGMQVLFLRIKRRLESDYRKKISK